MRDGGAISRSTDLVDMYFIAYIAGEDSMVSDERPALPVFFYRTKAGVEPVRTWLKELPDNDRRKIGSDLHRVQMDWPVGMPLCRSLGRGLWELRSSLPSGRIARLIFFVED